jgi:hypothetical protein
VKRLDSLVQYGDHQTPPHLAARVAGLLERLNIHTQSVLEPTCGVGNLLAAVLQVRQFAAVRGLELNPDHAALAQQRLNIVAQQRVNIEIRQADFFAQDMNELYSSLPTPRLVLANPPWVTHAAVTSTGGDNLPKKQNPSAQGLAARTGKSNFDLSEAVLLPLLERMTCNGDALVAIIKTSVARKLLKFAAQKGWCLGSFGVFLIDAKTDFAAAVDACIFVCSTTLKSQYDCPVYATLESTTPLYTISVQDQRLVADKAAYQASKAFLGRCHLEWRSGIKHDCASIMELKITAQHLQNGLGERPDLEAHCLYPLLKSSDLGNGRTTPRAMLLVTQSHLGEETRHLAKSAPKTWAYLQAHREKFAARGSSIYQRQPEFALFGVGSYSFAPYKVAISGLYKRLEFVLVMPYNDLLPVVFDDTCYFLPCQSEAEARVLHTVLSSPMAQNALNALIFWDEKRPITKERLAMLELGKVAAAQPALLTLLQNAHPHLSLELHRSWFGLQRADVGLFDVV